MFNVPPLNLFQGGGVGGWNDVKKNTFIASNSAICDVFFNNLCFLVIFRNLAFSQKAPIKVFCFCLILARGTPIKRAEKASQRGQDEDGKKIRVSCVLGFENFPSLWIINEFLHLSTPQARIFFSPSSWPLWDIFSALFGGVPWAKIKRKQKDSMGAFWEIDQNFNLLYLARNKVNNELHNENEFHFNPPKTPPKSALLVKFGANIP